MFSFYFLLLFVFVAVLFFQGFIIITFSTNQDDDDEEFKGVRQRWTLEEDKKLRAAVAAIGTKNWRRISEEYFDELRTEDSLSVRWFRIRDNKK
jgi:hypothetical protein